jgi:hypothetical protein
MTSTSCDSGVPLRRIAVSAGGSIVAGSAERSDWRSNKIRRVADLKRAID